MSDELNESNFRDFAKRAIKKYLDDGMLIDGMVWGRIIRLYEKALKQKDEPQPRMN